MLYFPRLFVISIFKVNYIVQPSELTTRDFRIYEKSSEHANTPRDLQPINYLFFNVGMFVF